MRTCVTPDRTFVFGLHKPSYSVRNLRSRTRIERLGAVPGGGPVDNQVNYPEGDVEVEAAEWIYEIANPFPFRGTTYINKSWADRSAEDPGRIRIPPPETVSLHRCLAEQLIDPALIGALPRPLLLSLAVTSTDPDDLILLARKSCRFEFDHHGRPAGLRYSGGRDNRALIDDFELFEAVANNAHLPDDYRIAMVIRPGAQGASEIVGDYHDGEATHVYEYLRRNSYIGDGHYAANMAEDALRYRIEALSASDIRGLRHLYYQRSYTRLAAALSLPVPGQALSEDELEALRLAIAAHPGLADAAVAATLWGWNFGFDFSSSGYRLHASHQQIHQQYALIPARVEGFMDGFGASCGDLRSFSAGDMIEEVIEAYRSCHRRSFFHDYLDAIAGNQRMDGRRDRGGDLVLWQDEEAMLFVPKAQTSQWELQLITKPDDSGRFAGHIVDCDRRLRRSLDLGILTAQRTLAALGATMVTTIEYAKRFGAPHADQPLLYSFLPKLPHSPGAFSEAQLRFINGHYPEDFAAACRRALAGK